MNFLAHLYLADDNPEALVGSIMPDLARPRGWSAPQSGTSPLRTASPGLPPATLRAIAQHRALDAFTDSHPVFRRSKQRIRRYGHYASILVDILYDHFLARDWHRYSTVPLSRFVDQVYEAFASHVHLMPPVMRGPVQRLRAQDWLGSYATKDGIEEVLRRMSLRFSQRFDRAVRLEDVLADLRFCGAALADDFHEFFPQIITFAKEQTDFAAKATITAAR